MKSFIDFLKENDILAAIIATVISTYVANITDSFINDLFLPIINRDTDNDGKPDIKNLEKYELIFLGIKFKIGKFLINLIKFIAIIFLIYLIYLFKNRNKRTNIPYKINWERYSPSFIRK